MLDRIDEATCFSSRTASSGVGTLVTMTVGTFKLWSVNIFSVRVWRGVDRLAHYESISVKMLLRPRTKASGGINILYHLDQGNGPCLWSTGSWRIHLPRVWHGLCWQLIKAANLSNISDLVELSTDVSHPKAAIAHTTGASQIVSLDITLA